jgi:hypothetical protein
MKATKILTLFVLYIALMMGCNKDEFLVNESGEPGLKSATTVSAFVVEPTGTDDTENLKNAFADAMAAGPGAVVQLTEGEYYIDLMEIYEFHGMLKGAGKGKTIISCIANLNVDDFINQNLKPVLLKFIGGNVSVCHLTIHTPQGPLSAGMIPWIHGQLAFCPITAQYVAENECVKAIVDNVEFITEGNVRNGLLAESDFLGGVPGGVPLADIDITVTNSSFSEGYWWYGALLMEIREGRITAGTPNNGNVFNNSMLSIWHNTSVNINVRNNTFRKVNGKCGLEVYSAPYPAALQQYPQTFASVCNIEKNSFEITGTTKAALVLVDNRRVLYPEEIPMHVNVKNNRFSTVETNTSTIRGFVLYGPVIRNNKFVGGGLNGLFLDGPSEALCENGLILGNNFSNTLYSDANVVFGPGTRDWTVVGGNLGESVWDFGENNLISGFNITTSEVPFGQTIKDNLGEMKSRMHSLTH